MSEFRYFELFDLPACFAMDEVLLEARYRELAAQCHPDRFAAQSPFEQKQAMMMAASVNDAYRILKDPANRASYLLEAEGIAADAPEHTHFAGDFLMQQMQWREELEEAEAAADEGRLGQLAADVAQYRAMLLKELAVAFETHDFDKAADSVRRCRFSDKLLQEIDGARS